VVLCPVEVFVFGGWTILAGTVKAPVVVPVHPLHGGDLHIVQALPQTSAVDQLALVQSDRALGQGIVITVPGASR
jgi:hypothetical protein